MALDWERYAIHFRNAALGTHRTPEYVEACLSYARKLAYSGLPIIYDSVHLAAVLGYSHDYVLASAYGAEAFYREFTVKKRAGGERRIDEPLPSLKELQRWVLDNILAHIATSPNAKGFIRGKSVKDNAKFHRRQPYVLKLDVQDFFPSIKRERIYGLFRSFGYSQRLANLLARLCCLRGCLPQGAPTSPALSNLVCRTLDARFAGFARKRRMRYTRYADDITFSGTFEINSTITFVRRVLREEGFQLNERKTRLMERHQQQEVTGIVVNDGMRARRRMRRWLRQAVYYIKKYGLNSHLVRIQERHANYTRHLLGKANFILFVDPTDRNARAEYELLHQLLRERGSTVDE